MSHDDHFNFDPAFDDDEEIIEDDPDTLHDEMKEDLP